MTADRTFDYRNVTFVEGNQVVPLVQMFGRRNCLHVRGQDRPRYWLLTIVDQTAGVDRR